MVKISPGWVTGPEQSKSSGRIATFNLWTAMFSAAVNLQDSIITALKNKSVRSSQI